MNDRAETTRALAARAAAFASDLRTNSDLAAGKIEYRQGHHSFSQLVDWQSLVLRTLSSYKGLVAIDADESINQVRVDVLPGTANEPIERSLAAAGLPASAVRIVYSGGARSLNLRNRFPNGLGGGMQIANSQNNGVSNIYTCTLGFNVVTQFYGEQGFLTASHCAEGGQGLGAIGGPIYQNVKNASFQVGSILLNPAWNRTDAECGGYPCTWADAMLVQHSNPALSVKVVAATTYLGQNGALGSIFENAWRINVQPVPYTFVGQVLDKVGRTTGWTRGTVTATCAAVFVASDHWVLCSDKVTGSTSGPGDSGAPVFIPGAQTTWAAGILFAGSAGFYQLGADGTSWCLYDLDGGPCYYWFSSVNAIQVSHLPRYFSF